MYGCDGLVLSHTSCRSTNGGPSAMSSAFVPGLMRREAPASTELPGNLPCSSNNATPGDAGPSWSSAIGGGDGRRGDEAGDRAAIATRCLGAIAIQRDGVCQRYVEHDMDLVDEQWRSTTMQCSDFTCQSRTFTVGIRCAYLSPHTCCPWPSCGRRLERLMRITGSDVPERPSLHTSYV